MPIGSVLRNTGLAPRPARSGAAAAVLKLIHGLEEAVFDPPLVHPQSIQGPRVPEVAGRDATERWVAAVTGGLVVLDAPPSADPSISEHPTDSHESEPQSSSPNPSSFSCNICDSLFSCIVIVYIYTIVRQINSLPASHVLRMNSGSQRTTPILSFRRRRESTIASKPHVFPPLRGMTARTYSQRKESDRKALPMQGIRGKRGA